MDSNILVLILGILLLFVLPIVFAGIWTGHKKEMAKANAQLDSTEKQALKDELAAVKKRLEVLEAIVTDKKYQLGEEISSLKAVD